MDKVKSLSATGSLLNHPPAEARCQARPGPSLWAVLYEILNESGFGGWADEKVEMAREAALYVLLDEPGQYATEFNQSHLLLSRKISHSQHLTISFHVFRLTTVTDEPIISM
jgi:hypothetical protein